MYYNKVNSCYQNHKKTSKMTDPYQPVIDLTEYSLSEHGNAATPVIELVDEWFIQPNRSSRTTSNQSTTPRGYPRVIYPRRHIVNEVPIEVPDSPQVEYNNASIRRKVTRKSKVTNQENEQNDNTVDPVRERSPLGGNFGVCPICLETLGNQPLASTNCGHVFCQMCLTHSLRSEKKCPTCRKSLRGSTAYHALFLNRG